MKFNSFTYAALASSVLLGASPVSGQAASTTSLVLNAMTDIGCFNSSTPLTDQGPYTFQTAGYCQKICVGLNKAVMALSGGSNCWCGDEVPAANTMVDSSNCNTPCYGYGQDTCGGDGFYMVELTGVTGSVPTYSPSSSAVATSTDTPASTTSTPAVVTVGGQTVVVTKASETSATSSSSKGPNKAGIAAGVVVGVVVIGAAAGGAFLYFRRKRRAEVEEEYRRNAAIASFAAKPGSVSSSMGDSRLEPAIMAQRRMSDGSIADNQDYSRRILKVMNPDGS